MRYSGGKARLSKEITQVVLALRGDRWAYIEPFVGGGSSFASAAPHFRSAIAADASADLIALWQAIAAGWEPPKAVTEEEYRAARHAEPSPLRTFIGFGCSFSGKWWGGYARPHAGSQPNPVGSSYDGIQRKRGAFEAATAILHSDYADLTRFMLPGVVAYCDPPYAGTLGYSASGAWDPEKFWRTAEEWAHQGALVLVSEYAAPRGWGCVWSKERRMSMRTADGAQPVKVEKLFTYGEI